MIDIIIVMIEVEKGFFWLRLMMRGGGRELSSRRGIKKILLTTGNSDAPSDASLRYPGF